MYDVDALLRTITAIYSVPGSPERWSGVVGEINRLVEGSCGIYMLVNAESQTVEISASNGYRQDVLERYRGPDGMAKDIRFQHMSNLIPGKVFRESEYVLDRAAYDANEWIRYEREVSGIYWCMTSHISTHGLWHDILSVNRLHDLGPYSDDQKASMQALLPHLSRAAELNRVVSRLEERYGAVLAVLDKLLVGLVLLDRNGCIATANHAARAASDSTGLLALKKDGRLQARDPKVDATLQSLIKRACLTSNAEDQFDGESLVVNKLSGNGALLLEVIPIRDDGFSDSDRLRGAAVFIIDPQGPCQLSVEGLSKIFALTSSENAIAHSLVNGLDLRDVADARRTSIETVRSQLKSIFSKSGVNSRLELVRLAVKATPPIADG